MNTPPTIVIERTMKAPAERIYKAFLDPKTLARFQAPAGTEVIYEAFKAKVGAANRYEFRTGPQRMRFNIRFLELKEFTTIRHTYVMDMPGMDTEMEILITLKETKGTTLVRFEQRGLPKPIPASGAKAGWTQMLDRLAALVET